VGIREWLRKLEREAEEEVIEIQQCHGTVKRYNERGLLEASWNWMERLRAGEDAPPEHPLTEAARSSSDLKWSKSFLAIIPTLDEYTDGIPALSE
jgi:hypothetical protein